MFALLVGLLDHLLPLLMKASVTSQTVFKNNMMKKYAYFDAGFDIKLHIPLSHLLNNSSQLALI